MALPRIAQRLDARVERVLPGDLNPLAQAGALANATFGIALATGILLLFWYDSSVHTAYASLERTGFLGQLMRSLHRYSSDACMLLVVVHAVRLFVARRFTGARWMAWLSGVVLIGLLWLDGWTGYWLVWDDRAAAIARGSAHMLDVLPIFADPLSRSFLTDQGVNTLLFFVVFFVHMLIPAAMGAALLVHILRLSRPRFLPTRRMAVLVAVSLVAVSVLWPARSGPPAQMAVIPSSLSLDVFYMLPILLTDRLTGGVLWLLGLAALGAASTMPWWLAERRAPVPVVAEKRCNGCQRCATDCPFNAVHITPRQDGRPVLATIDPAKCVSCGICVGSCNPAAIDFPDLTVELVRGRLDGWLGERPDPVAFVCAQAARLSVDAASGRCVDLPGFRVVSVPCSGWVHALLVERALRHGAPGVLIGGCEGSDPLQRLGDEWTGERLDGLREPSLRRDRGRVLHVSLGRDELIAAAAAFREERVGGARPPVGTVWRLAAGMAAAVLILAATVAGASVGYVPRGADQTRLVVSFKHPGQVVDSAPAAVADPSVPVHMRAPAGSGKRGRAAVRLQVDVDGRTVVDRVLAPSGLFRDGNSVAMESVAVSPGRHEVEVRIADDGIPTWRYVDRGALDFEPGRRRVVLFDRMTGFSRY